LSLYARLKTNGPSGFGYGSTAEDVTEGLSLEGKTILVTGCNSGLGLETSRVLAMRGARVVGTARTVEKAKEAVTGQSVPLACELSDPASVRDCIAKVKEAGIRLDAIVCNAGIMALPKLEKQHGYEAQFFTNHIGHFILVTGLLDDLTEKGRVVMVSSEAHRRAPREGVELDDLDGKKRYDPWRNYGQSKMANILFASELSRRLATTKKTANSLHPGVIATNLARHMNPVVQFIFSLAKPLALKTIAQGAATQVYLATHPSVAEVSGKYFSDCNPKTPRDPANDEALATKLWKRSEEIVAGLS
jgi:WW domain-containing oxidoreductase